MSSYINFYLRVNDSFAPIGSFSRNCEIYREMSGFCPYEKIRAFSIADLKVAINNLKEKEEQYERACDKYKSQCEKIMQANNSLDEKMEAINSIESSIEELNFLIKEIQDAENTLYVFCDMIDDYQYDETNFSNDYNHYIYAGIEAYGSLETVEE